MHVIRVVISSSDVTIPALFHTLMNEHDYICLLFEIFMHTAKCDALSEERENKQTLKSSK